MSIFTHAGRAALAEIVLSRPIHLALGLGEDSWGAPPPAPDYDVTTLRREIGRKKLFRGLFVHPDDHGTLILPGDRKYSISDTPTRHLYLQFLFDYNEGAGGAIRELGLFLNTKAKADLPPTQTFFRPEELENGGTLLLLEHLENPDTYNPQKKGEYETVLSF